MVTSKAGMSLPNDFQQWNKQPKMTPTPLDLEVGIA